MSPELLGRLFVPFTQGDASITRKFGGTGLGLTISRQLAKLLSGDVTATSQPGIGSTFTVKVDGGPSAGVERLEGLTESTLPATADQKMQASVQLSGRILLVEDGADNQQLLRMQLGDAGATVTSALDGQIAVDLATTQTFDLILMDMQMPVMDGYAATIELRRIGLTIPIIALTAYAMAEDRDRCMTAGCSAYLSKPIEEDTLLRTVREHLGTDPASVPNDRGAADAAGPPLPTADAGGSNFIKSSLAGNPRVMQIMPEFVDGLPGNVGKMIDLLKRNDLSGVEWVAHQLLGVCGGYGFAAVSQPARTVERSIKAGKDLGSITTDVQTLIELIRRIDGYDQSKESAAAEESMK
jgi:CheY-like chemotaxis protein/HPt (histidine-containing phosphotransfer) domain-containing protein